LLVAQASAAREARIDLSGGSFAGASIHVASRPDGIEIRIGAPSDLTRETLSRLVDHVGLRLRSRGIVVRTGRSLDARSRDRERGESGGDHPSRGGP
jgi:hypothetical protein